MEELLYLIIKGLLSLGGRANSAPPSMRPGQMAPPPLPPGYPVQSSPNSIPTSGSGPNRLQPFSAASNRSGGRTSVASAFHSSTQSSAARTPAAPPMRRAIAPQRNKQAAIRRFQAPPAQRPLFQRPSTRPSLTGARQSPRIPAPVPPTAARPAAVEAPSAYAPRAPQAAGVPSLNAVSIRRIIQARSGALRNMWIMGEVLQPAIALRPRDEIL